MFSQEARCLYRHNALGEVICQLRFPEILSINATPPADFQDAIRDEFPLYACRKENGGADDAVIHNYQFSSADGAWRVNLTCKFISLSCSRYTCWEDFAKKLDKPLVSFIKIYKPAFFERVGLRYLNFFSRKALELEGYPFRELFSPCWLGILAEADVAETATSRCSVDTELTLRGCRAKIHAGPGMVKRDTQADPELKFIFDQDLFIPGTIPVNQSVGVLQTLHSQAYSIFRGAITDTLRDAMEPISL